LPIADCGLRIAGSSIGGLWIGGLTIDGLLISDWRLTIADSLQSKISNP
jgi:hypothetical protein